MRSQAALVCPFACLLWSRTYFLVDSARVFLTDLPGSDLSLPPHLISPLHLRLKRRAHYCLSSVMPGSGLRPSCCYWCHLAEMIFRVMKFSTFLRTLKMPGLWREQARASFRSARCRFVRRTGVVLQPSCDSATAAASRGAEKLPRHLCHHQKKESMLRLFRSFEIVSSLKCFCFIYRSL